MSYNPLRYLLLFLFEEQGRHINMTISTPYVSWSHYNDVRIKEPVRFAKSLSASIIHFFCIIAEINIIYYIGPVCSRNISRMQWVYDIMACRMYLSQ